MPQRTLNVEAWVLIPQYLVQYCVASYISRSSSVESWYVPYVATLGDHIFYIFKVAPRDDGQTSYIGRAEYKYLLNQLIIIISNHIYFYLLFLPYSTAQDTLNSNTRFLHQDTYGNQATLRRCLQLSCYHQDNRDSDNPPESSCSETTTVLPTNKLQECPRDNQYQQRYLPLEAIRPTGLPLSAKKVRERHLSSTCH